MTQEEEIRAAFMLDAMVAARIQVFVNTNDDLVVIFPARLSDDLFCHFNHLVDANYDLLKERIKREAGRRGPRHRQQGTG